MYTLYPQEQEWNLAGARRPIQQQQLLHADAYSDSSRSPENIRAADWWAPLRRKFDKAVNAMPKGQQAGCAVLEDCNARFGIERKLAGLPPEERYKQRLARSKPVIDALLVWAETGSTAVTKSALDRALYYLQAQRSCLIQFLEDRRLEISSNRAKCSVTPL